MTGQQMPARTALSELIERVEKANGPDRELDVLVGAEVNLFADNNHLSLRKTLEICGMAQTIEMAESHQNILRTELPRYTASIDNALTLLPEGYAVERLSLWNGCPSSCTILETHHHNGEYWHQWKDGRWGAECATPALALTAACLKALSAFRSATQDTEARHE